MRTCCPAVSCLFILATLAACAPAPQPVAPQPTASPDAGASPAPASAGPSAAASATPSASPTASPTTSLAPSSVPSAAGYDLTAGKVLRKYDFQGLAGLHYDFSRDQLWVVDAVNDKLTPPRYLARRFGRDGTFDATIDLNKVGEQAPEAVDGFAFDLSGVPAFTFRDRNDRFNLRRIYTATVEDATRLPSSSVERGGIAALAADGNVFTLGTLSLDPDVVSEFDTKDREILYSRGAEELDPEAIFRIKDPLAPTSRMAMAPGGELYLFGPVPGGALGVKRLDKTQALVDLPISLARIPDRVWIAPNGDLLLSEDSTGSTPAKIRQFTSAGTLVGETEVRLADGQMVFRVSGLTFDARGKVVIAGIAIAPDLVTTTGLFSYD